MAELKYIIKPRATQKIFSFYSNVAKKYRHTYDKTDLKHNVHDAVFSIYQIERTLLRREPTNHYFFPARYHSHHPTLARRGCLPLAAQRSPSVFRYKIIVAPKGPNKKHGSPRRGESFVNHTKTL